MGQGERSNKLSDNKDKTRNANQILTAVALVVAIVAVFVDQLAVKDSVMASGE